MMRIEPELGGVSIVLIGNLNPRIFNPDWFARHQLLASEEAGTAKLDVIHEEVSQFSTSWFALSVTRNRFALETTQAPYVRVFDLVVRIFREQLSHTPIRQMGINRTVHFDVGSFENRDRIGRTLAPWEPWGKWAEVIADEELTKHGGVRSLTMEMRQLDDRPVGWIRAKVEPSKRIKNGVSGIFMEVNDHFEAEDSDKVVGCDAIMDILEKSFEASVQRSESIIDQIMSLK